MTHYTNPLLPAHSPDPWITWEDGFYYYCESRNNFASLHVRKSKCPFEIGQQAATEVWRAPQLGANSHALWAPELHRWGNRWYIYYAADDGKNANHRMWVLESESSNPQGSYRCRGQLETSGWAIDGTLLTLGGETFFVWSGWPGKRNGQQNLYIAPMHNPWTLAAPRTLLTQPAEPWECVEMKICEGPQILQRHGKIFLIYSASGSWTVDYCLGMLTNTSGDVLNPLAWEKCGQVFGKSESVWGVGHCSFVQSPCGTHDLIFYHSKSKATAGWEDREVHAQRFAWDARGYPIFGTPAGRGCELPRFPIPADMARAA
jgi:GH43 family beta-xylosidase